jgi:putative transcriptional regulator
MMGESLRGSLLIAARGLRDGNFFRSAVLMLEHTPDGAMGLIVNRPSDTTVKDAISTHFEFEEEEPVLYVGGPVEQNSLLLLHNLPEYGSASGAVVPGVYLGGSEGAFAEVIRRAREADADLRYRVFSGYSGWGPLQLEGEIERNDWLWIPADEGLVFADDPYDVWEEAVSRFRMAHPLVELPGPTDPGLN